MREVIPQRLWLGNAGDARNPGRVLDAGITAVVNLAGEELPPNLPRDVIANIKPEDQGQITLGFRPESLDIVSAGTQDSFPVVVEIVEELGSDAFVYGSLTQDMAGTRLSSGAGEAQIIVRVDPRRVPAKGETIWVRVREGEQHQFHAASGERFDI